MYNWDGLFGGACVQRDTHSLRCISVQKGLQWLMEVQLEFRPSIYNNDSFESRDRNFRKYWMESVRRGVILMIT